MVATALSHSAALARLGWMLQYRMQQVALDIDNAFSAVIRAEERIHAAAEALAYAQTLVKGNHPLSNGSH